MALIHSEELSPAITRIVLSDPENLNAMSEEMAHEFRLLVDLIRSKTDRLRAVILTGAGRAFSSGGAFSMLDQKVTLSGEKNRTQMHLFYDSFLSIRTLPVPIIAAINGAAVGAGLCLACACDIRLVSENAKLSLAFTRLGLHPGMGATYLVPRLIGYAAASDLLLSARVFDAQEALRVGLVSRVVPQARLEEEARALAEEICMCGPEATRQLLETLRADPPPSLRSALEREALCQSVNYASAEFKEGLRAVRDKRATKFS